MVAGDVRYSTCDLLIDTDFIRTARYPTERNTYLDVCIYVYLDNRLIVNGIFLQITIVSPRIVSSFETEGFALHVANYVSIHG